MTNLAVGTLTLLLAGFAPWLAIKMVHFAGDSFHLAHSQAAAAGTGARTVVAAPQKVASSYQRHRTLMPIGAGSSSSHSRSTTSGQGKPPAPPAAGAPATGGSAAAAGPAGAALLAASAIPRAASNAARNATERGINTGEPPPGPARPPARA
jgi:hypothetical protein